MRDVDALMRYEGDQQRLVDEIISSLHRETEHDHIPAFRAMAIEMIRQLEKERPCAGVTDTTHRPLIDKHIITPIRNFTQGKGREERYIERKYLLGMVLQKLVDSIRSRLQTDWGRLEILKS